MTGVGAERERISGVDNEEEAGTTTEVGIEFEGSLRGRAEG